MSRIVKRILFDAQYKGHKYQNLDLGYHSDPDVDEDYIKSEDGPWGMVEVGNDIIDFQIYCEPDEPDVFKMDACLMNWNENSQYYSHGDFLLDIEITNIRVEYD